MANMLMLAQMGLSVAGSLTSFASGRIESDMQSAYQKYRNAISVIDTSMKHNTVVLNEIAQRDASLRQAGEIQEQALRDRGSADVAAAAAGVKGNSVNLTMRELARSQSLAEKTRVDNLKSAYLASAGEKKSVVIAGVMNKDISVIPKPSVTAALAGAGASLLNIWDSHQTPGDKIASRMSRLGG